MRSEVETWKTHLRIHNFNYTNLDAYTCIQSSEPLNLKFLRQQKSNSKKTYANFFLQVNTNFKNLNQKIRRDICE